MICGSQVLYIISWSDKIGSYAYLLVCILFAGLYLGKKESTSVREIFREVGDSFCIDMETEFVCFSSALFIGTILLKIVFNWAARHGITRFINSNNNKPYTV